MKTKLVIIILTLIISLPIHTSLPSTPATDTMYDSETKLDDLEKLNYSPNENFYKAYYFSSPSSPELEDKILGMKVFPFDYTLEVSRFI